MAKQETFVASVVNSGKSSGKITHPIESNGPKRRRAGFYGYGMGSALNDIPGNEMAASADAAYAACGGCDGGAPAAGESVDIDTFKACMEAAKEQMGDSPLADEINNLFNKTRGGKTNAALYSGADGMETVTDEEPADAIRENVISSAAAACEAALRTFKMVAGVDYWVFRH